MMKEINRLIVVHNHEYDGMEVYDTSIDDINKDVFADYFKKEFGQSYDEKGLTFEEALKAKRILRNGQLSLAGLLFFGKIHKV